MSQKHNDNDSWNDQSFDPYRRASEQWGIRTGSGISKIFFILDFAFRLGAFTLGLIVLIRFLPYTLYVGKPFFNSVILGKSAHSEPAYPKEVCGDHYLSSEVAKHYLVVVSGIRLEDAQALCGNASTSLENQEIYMAAFDSYNEAVEFASSMRIRFESVRIDEKEVHPSF